MYFNKPVSNAMLMGTIELMKEEPNQERRDMFVEELIKAEFLAPVIITPPPVADKNGKPMILKDSKVQFPELSTKDGKKYLMAFTDKKELEKWRPEEEKQSFTLNLDDYVSMLLRKDDEGNPSDTLGFVINPFGCNVIISKELLAQIVVARLAKEN